MHFECLDNAKENLDERHIRKELVGFIVLHPHMILEGRFGRKIAHLMLGDKVLRVVYEIQDNDYIIVTAYYAYAKGHL